MSCVDIEKIIEKKWVKIRKTNITIILMQNENDTFDCFYSIYSLHNA